jgi:hypothetical protein
MKRADLLHAVMQRLRDAARSGGLGCEPRGAECAGPAEYVVTVYGTPTEVTRLALVLGQDPELNDVQVVEDLGAANSRLQSAADAGRCRHLHIALSIPTLW